jgi:uncharacterized alpha-E superfamily protein
MLSRVAESLYWMGRYLERAEGTAGLLHVSFHAALDTATDDRASGWRDLLALGGHDALFAEHVEGPPDAGAVSEFLLFDRANPDAVVACVERARENARGVREQISSELWEHVNRLHHFVRDTRPAAVLHAPHDFFARIREGSHAFQGIAKATMPHGEGYAFLELGAHLERAGLTGRVVNVKMAVLERSGSEPDVASAQLTALLKSCGAFEALRRQERSSTLRAEPVVAFLLLDRAFPRSVLFCLETAQQMLTRVAGGSGRTQRLLGRVCSELVFSDPRDLLVGPLRATLDPLLARIDEAGVDVASTYFNTQALSPGSVAIAAAAQQQQ